MKNEAEKGLDWNWGSAGTCHFGASPGLKHNDKIASFDMDDTIINRKSGAKFPKDADDWIWLNDKVKPKLQEL